MWGGKRRFGSAQLERSANEDGTQALLNAALDQFAIPGDASFPLNQAFEAPRDRQDAETLRQYDDSKHTKTNYADHYIGIYHKCDKSWR